MVLLLRVVGSFLSCGPRNFLLFSAKDLVKNDAAKLDATIDKAAVGSTDGAGRIDETCCRSRAQRGH